jgi:DNA repair protein RecN (Recombination protein N)
MLTQLCIQDFTLVEKLELEFSAGMTVITGETGAGKSILLDALGLAIGDKTEADRVRQGATRADITATFDTQRIVQAQEWLAAHDLQQADAPHECLLRRLINNEGKSRSYINGQPVTLQQLRELGDMLIDIHSQHEHQSLLHKDTHLRLLDEFGQHTELAKQVRAAFSQWHEVLERFIRLRDNSAEMNARYQLLRYQVEELDALGLQEGEIEQLETEQKKLASAEDTLANCQQLIELCNDDHQGLSAQIYRALHLLKQVPHKSKHLQTAEECLQNAQIQLDEARQEISLDIDNFELDPERLQIIEQRLSQAYDLARKHRVKAQELPALYLQISNELTELDAGDGKLDELQQQVEQSEKHYLQLAEKLSTQRQKTAKKLAQQVNDQLKALAMTSASFSVQIVRAAKASGKGLDDIEFLISTNPGQPPKSLAKVASGGELSRISLAIQVVTAQTSAIPTLVFDEVDVGIGGATGEVVGKLLRQLGEQGQVLCVTHLAQVASKGHQHLQVQKTLKGKQAVSQLVELTGEERIQEIARMMSGEKLTESSIAHARDLMAL